MLACATIQQSEAAHFVQQEISNRDHKSLVVNLEDLEKVRGHGPYCKFRHAVAQG